MGDREPAAPVALADREGRRGDGLVTPSARQAPRISVVLPAPTSPLTTTTSPGSSRTASSAPSASVSAAEAVSTLRRSTGRLTRRSRADRRGRRRLGGGLLARAPLPALRRGTARARLASRAGIVAKSSRSVSFTAGVRSAAAGWKSGSRKTVRPPSSCTCGVPRTLVIPVGLPLSSLVAKLPRVQTTVGSISRTCSEEVGLAGLDLQRLRVAVARRARLQHVGDEDLLAREPDLVQQLVEQLAGAADEGQALAVLFGPGASPTNIRSALASPAPKTALVRVSYSGQLGAGR